MNKVLSLRLNPKDEQKLRTLAENLDIGPSVLARMLLHTSLSQLEQLDTDRFPLSLLSDLLAPLAQAKGVEEADLARSVKAVRKRLSTKHYGKLS